MKQLFLQLLTLALLLGGSCFLFCDYCGKRFINPTNTDTTFLNRLVNSNVGSKAIKILTPCDTIFWYGIVKRNGLPASSAYNLLRYSDFWRKNNRNYSEITINYKTFLTSFSASENFSESSSRLMERYGKDGVWMLTETSRKCCVSGVLEAQAGAESGCQPLGYFYSEIIFQDSTILIEIKEKSTHKRSGRINNYLKQIFGDIDLPPEMISK
jgi:hypothetical protein